jgi:GGDEF domain-containing protein
VAQRLEGVIGNVGRVGRLGGDEFQVIMPARSSAITWPIWPTR